MNRVSPTSDYTLAITLFACAGILACTLTYPLNNDNALYAYMGDLLLKGKLPYIGSWDQNFPAIIWAHALQILVSGHSQLAFHIFDVAIQLVGSYLLFRTGSLLYDNRAGMLAAILTSLYYVQQGFWMAGERDTYVTILLIAAFYFALRNERAFVVGILAGLTFLFRPTYGLYPVIFFFWYLFESPKSTNALSNIAGSILPSVALLLLLFFAKGMKEFWDATILFNFKIYSGEGASFAFWEPIRFYAVSVIAVVIALWYLWKSNRNALLLWGTLLGASLVSLLLLYRHSVYHYHPTMTLFILMSAVGWIRLVDLLSVKAKIFRFVLPTVVLLFFVLQTFRGNTITHVLTATVNGQIHTLEDSYQRYEPSPTFGVRVQEEVGSYLRIRTHANDMVQMFGPYSYPQYRAGLLTASRFQTLHAITMRGRGDTLQSFQQQWRAEYLKDMRTNRPIYFIVCDAPEAFRQYYGGRLGHEILHEDFLELGSWLDSNYYPETKIGAFTLYRRRG